MIEVSKLVAKRDADKLTEEQIGLSGLRAGGNVLMDKRLEHLQKEIKKQGVSVYVDINEIPAIEYKIQITNASPELENQICAALGIYRI